MELELGGAVKPVIPKRCKNCKYFGTFHKEYTACYAASILTIILEGPMIVSPDGYCSDFEYNKRNKRIIKNILNQQKKVR